MAGWVCPECGLDYDTIKPLDTIRAVRSFPYRYRALIKAVYRDRADAEELMRRRPAPETWSALEYTAHVADILDTLAPDIRRIVVDDKPTLPAFDHEERIESRGYNELPVREALSLLESSCSDVGMTLDGLGADDWARTGTYPWGERDALAVARNAVHEGSHHLRDIERGLEQLGFVPSQED